LRFSTRSMAIRTLKDGGDNFEDNGDELDSAAGCHNDRLCPIGSVRMPDVPARHIRHHQKRDGRRVGSLLKSAKPQTNDKEDGQYNDGWHSDRTDTQSAPSNEQSMRWRSLLF
jgi:hypothetical protein